MAESDAATMERLRKEMGEKVEIPVPEGMIPVHGNKATAVLAAPAPGRSGEVAREHGARISDEHPGRSARRRAADALFGHSGMGQPLNLLLDHADGG